MAQGPAFSVSLMLERAAASTSSAWGSASNQAVGVGLIAALCSPVLVTVPFQGLPGPKKPSGARSSSRIGFSGELTALPWSLVAGLGAGLAAAALRAWSGEDGIDAVSCAILSAYTIVIMRRGPRRSSTSIFAGITSGLCLTSTALASVKERLDSPNVKLLVLQSLSGVLVAAGYLALPRGPDERAQGRPVDREECCSIFDQVTFSWCKLFFDAERLANIGIADLPVLRSTDRADHLAREYARHSGSGQPNYRVTLAKTHAWSLIGLYSLTVLRAAAPLAPQAARFLLLQRLEDTVGGTDFYGIGLALGVGALSVLEIWIEAYVPWYMKSRVQIPIKSTITTLVYEKMLRLCGDQAKSGAVGSAEKRKTVANHLTSDSARAVTIYTDSTKLVRAAANLITTGAFLIKLMGWKGVVAGIIASLIPIPLIRWQSKRVREDQRGLYEQRDKSSALLADALNAIRQLKLTATDVTWREKLLEGRKRELALMWTNTLKMSFLVFIANISPDILTAIPLYIFATQNQAMSAAVAFTCIELFLQLQSEISVLPLYYTYLIEGWTSSKRLGDYFAEPEMTPRQGVDASDISLQDVNILWSNDEKENPFMLRDVTATFPSGELTVVEGETGSGKSLLLTSLAGEAEIVAGTYCCPQRTEVVTDDASLYDDSWISPNHVAIVTQTPWVENGTLQGNILFGLPMRKDRYNEVLSSCALNKDISGLAKGDMTIVGPKGAALSGGQRCRVALARALYSRAGVLILDDVLSAVDAEVREWLVDNALAGSLASGRTRILATHYASQCDRAAARLMQLEGGTVKHVKDMPAIPNDSTAEKLVDTKLSEGAQGVRASADESSEACPEKSRLSANGQHDKKVAAAEQSLWSPYVTYFKARGGFSSLVLEFSIYTAYETIRYGRTWWLKEWTAQGSEGALGKTDIMYYGLVFVVLSTANCCGTVIKSMTSSIVGYRASSVLFERMSTAVFGSSLQWLEGTSHGDITLRFSSDTNQIDQRLPHDIGFTFGMLISTSSILLASMSISPYMACVAGILLYIYYTMGRRLIRATNYLDGISSLSMRSILDHVTSVTAPDGIPTIRAYGMTGHFTKRLYELLDNRAAALWHHTLCEAMMNLQLGAFGAIFLTFVAVAAVLTKASPGDTAIALTFATRFRRAVVGLLMRASTVRSGLECVRKVAEYGDLEMEPTDGTEAVAQWPAEGRVEVSGFSAGYSGDLPPALKNVSFSVAPGERVGVVGRTGAGKTSLTLAFARLIERHQGEIVIDGVDIATLNLHTLRKRLFIIPQDPHLFAGTVRSVLDPEGELADEALLGALKLMRSGNGSSEKTASSENVFTDLSMEISQGGRNVSQGQRQILYLACAFVSASKVVIMDEATSAIDLETDAVIQEAIRKGLKGSTVIVVAHRLATIADFDKVLVLDGGEVVEFGSPAALYGEKGAFWNLVQHSADRDDLVKKMSIG